jgi:hypothetical protein
MFGHGTSHNIIIVMLHPFNNDVFHDIS